jgi:hypothetical protein
MALPEIDQVKDAALKYDKKALAKMVQMGQLSPTIATMAAMMRDRIVQSEMKPPEQATVVDEVFQPAQAAGLAAVPTNPQMFQGMAGGGIVAMAGGGDVPRYQGLSGSVVQNPNPVSFTGALSGERQVDKQRLRAYYLANGLPLPDELKTREELAAVRGEERGPAGSMAELIGADRLVAPSGRINEPSLFSQFLEREKAKAMGGAPSAEYPTGTPLVPQGASMPTPAGSTPMENRAIVSPGDVRKLEAAAAKPPVRKPPVKPPAGLGATPEAAASPVTSVRDQAKAMAAEAVNIPAVPTVEEFIKRQSEMDERMGVDRKFEEKELAEIALQKANLKDERAQAANMRLLEAGLAIMGGASPYAFENIGKGASKALAGFTQDLKDIKKNETDLTNLQRQIKRAENQYRRDKSDKNLAEIEKLRQRAEDKTQERTKMEMDLELRLRKLGLDEKQLAAYKQQVAQGGTSPLERIAANLRAENPKLTYKQSIESAYGMQQEPKTRAALEREFLERPDLVKKYGTYDNYVKSTGSGGVDYKSKYGLD